MQLVVRVSAWTIAMQTVMDAFYCLLHLTTAVIYGTTVHVARPSPSDAIADHDRSASSTGAG